MAEINKKEKSDSKMIIGKINRSKDDSNSDDQATYPIKSRKKDKDESTGDSIIKSTPQHHRPKKKKRKRKQNQMFNNKIQQT